MLLTGVSTEKTWSSSMMTGATPLALSADWALIAFITRPFVVPEITFVFERLFTARCQVARIVVGKKKENIKPINILSFESFNIK